MNRRNFQDLARQRLREARRLLGARMAGGAYHLAGHAVECALKACIAKSTRRHDFPDLSRVRDTHSHDLSRLLDLANLKNTLDRDAETHRQLGVNWAVVKDWTVDSRYDPAMTIRKADDLYRAITMRRDGVGAWLRQHW